LAIVISYYIFEKQSRSRSRSLHQRIIKHQKIIKLKT